MSKVAIFVDYDNVYITLDQYYQKSSDKICLATDIINKIKECFPKDSILMTKAFADFQKVNTTLTILQKNQVELRHVYSTSSRKNASDIAMVISVIKSIYSNEHIDKYVIVSSDSDMLPLINEIQYFNKDVFVIYSECGSKEGYSDYLKSEKYKSIESLYGFQKYVPIIDRDYKNEDQIKSRLLDFLNTINDEIIRIFNLHISNGGGTASKKDIKEILYNTGKLQLVNNDASLIVDYLLSKGILLESKSANPSYNKVLINEKYIIENKINIKNSLLKESNYQKDKDGKIQKIVLTKA